MEVSTTYLQSAIPTSFVPLQAASRGIIESPQALVPEEPESVRGGQAPETGSTPELPPDFRAHVDRSVQDAMSLLMSAQLTLREAGNAVGAVQVGAAQQRQRDAQAAMERANHAIEKLAKKHGGIFHKKWFKVVLKAVAAVVAVAATVASFGSLGPVAIVGLALILGADLITKGLVKAGIVPKDKAVWVAAGLKLVGAAMTLGAGLASGGAEAGATAAEVGAEQAANAAAAATGAAAGTSAAAGAMAAQTAAAAAAQTAVQAGSAMTQAIVGVAQVVKDVGDVVQAVLTVIQLGKDIDTAVIARQIEEARARSVEARDDATEAGESIDDGVSLVRQVEQQHARIVSRIHDTQTIEDQAAEAAASMPV